MQTALIMLFVGVAIGSFPYEKLFTRYWVGEMEKGRTVNYPLTERRYLMTVKNMLMLIDTDEMVCIKDVYGKVLILGGNNYIPEQFYDFYDREIVKILSDNYTVPSLLGDPVQGITLVVGIK